MALRYTATGYIRRPTTPATGPGRKDKNSPRSSTATTSPAPASGPLSHVSRKPPRAVLSGPACATPDQPSLLPCQDHTARLNNSQPKRHLEPGHLDRRHNEFASPVLSSSVGTRCHRLAAGVTWLRARRSERLTARWR